MPIKDPEARRAYRRRYMREVWYPANRELHSGRVARNRATAKAALRDIRITLKSRPCADCGGVFPPECMDFDHVRGVKRDAVSRLGSPAAIRVEAEKCEVVCANCHRVRTRARRILKG